MPPADRRKRRDPVRNWTFTVHDLYELSVVLSLYPACAKYVTIGERTDPGTGRRSYRGYIQLKDRRKLDFFRSIGCRTARFTQAGSRVRRAQDFCWREKKLQELGQETLRGWNIVGKKRSNAKYRKKKETEEAVGVDHERQTVECS